MSFSAPLRPAPPPPPGAESPYLDYGPALPEGYGGPRVTALVRDPECFFACWEGGEAIRARDLADGSVREMSVLRAGSWYFAGLPEHEYEVELLSGGRVAAVSNRIRLPRRDPAVALDEDWIPTAGQEEVLRALAVRAESFRRGLEERLSS